MSILLLHQVSLTVANHCILDQVDWQIQPHDKVALVGRNGAGKSTLLKLLMGEFVQDRGQIHRLNGLQVAGLAQDVPTSRHETVYHFIVKGLGELGAILADFHAKSMAGEHDQLTKLQHQIDDCQAWDWLPKIDTLAMRLGLDVNLSMDKLSGGMKRRVLLAAALLTSPDLLLLDEPTNHLDIHAIEWLETYLKSYSGSLIVVTHDREFLARIATSIMEIDRGHLYRYDCNYEIYLDRREALRLSEKKHNDLFDKRLAEEEVWLRTGIKARRTRNEGRVRALEAMREAHQKRRAQLGKGKAIAFNVSRSGNIVLIAEQLNYRLGDNVLLRDFSFVLTRGDKVGIIGPNGCGKTTLVRLLLGELAPDSGSIRRGTSIEVAYFDQLRRQLDEQQTLMSVVGDGADYVTINGKQRHVASYLDDFLFLPEQFNQPVFSLSGGERNRLLLAKLFAKPVNFLVMDEPTNDLDLETLELLEMMLMDYPGTLLLISHDRAFINHVVTSVVVYSKEGHFNEYLGGYDSYCHFKSQCKKNPPHSIKFGHRSVKSIIKRSYSEQQELAKLPRQIEVLEQELIFLQNEMSTPVFYQQDQHLIIDYQKRYNEIEEKIAQLYARWEELEEPKA